MVRVNLCHSNKNLSSVSLSDSRLKVFISLTTILDPQKPIRIRNENRNSTSRFDSLRHVESDSTDQQTE